MTEPAAGPSFTPVPAVVRAIAILEFVSSKRDPVPLSAISQGLELPKSSTLGLLRTLVAEGLLSQDDRGGYGIGTRIVRFAGRHLAAIDLAQEFNAVVDAGPPTTWTVQLAVLDGTQVVYLARRDGARSLSLPSMTGRALPATTTSMGKAILAHYPASHVLELFPTPKAFPRNTPQSIGNIADFQRDLERTRERGYATDRSETVQGILGVGAPVWSFGHSLPTAAVSIAASDEPEVMAVLDDLGNAVADMARALSAKLGGLEQPPELRPH